MSQRRTSALGWCFISFHRAVPFSTTAPGLRRNYRPTRPRRLQPRLPRDLEAITLHCLEKEPSCRYPSALALAEDLRRFQEGKQVMARPVGAAARFARACRRRPLIATLLALLAVSLIGGISGVIWKWLEANGQRNLADARARQADDEKREACPMPTGIPGPGGATGSHDVDDARNLESGSCRLEWRHAQPPRRQLFDGAVVRRRMAS